jgi:signal transduction histidine kinase
MKETPDKNCPAKTWESVSLELSMEAVVGRLFSGTIHNLNGVVQAFSMQVELLKSMFQQCDTLIADLKEELTDHPGLEKLNKLDSLLKQRANLSLMLEEKVALAQNILQRNSLPRHIAFQDNEQSLWPCSVNDILKQEIDFLSADRFFKHQVDKNITYGSTVPQLTNNFLEFHQVCFCLLENSLIAMQMASNQNGARGQFLIESVVKGKCVVITIQDSGVGMSPETLPHIYQPFFTTWNGRKGLGLHYAKTICKRCGWEVDCVSRQNPTVFQIKIPL